MFERENERNREFLGLWFILLPVSFPTLWRHNDLQFSKVRGCGLIPHHIPLLLANVFPKYDHLNDENLSRKWKFKSLQKNPGCAPY